MADEKAPKLDGGKPPMHLVHPVFKRQLAEILAFGAKKYEPWSWMKGKEWSRDFAATQRHMDDWWLRKVDPETGASHLWHAGCDLMFLSVSEELGLGTDDRPPADDTVPRPKQLVAWEGGGCALCAAPSRDDNEYICDRCEDNITDADTIDAVCDLVDAARGVK